MKKKEQDPFNAFGWDEETTEVDFFGEIEKSVNPAKEEEEVSEETTDTKEVEEPEKKEDEVEDTEVFKDLEISAEDEEEDIEEDEEEDSPAPSKNLSSYKHLFDEGILELDEDEELPDTIDEKYITSKMEASIEKKFEESIGDLPEEVKNIIKYVHNGGDYRDFINNLNESSSISEDIDLDDEKNQEKVMRVLLQEDGQDEEEIDTQIEFLKDTGKLSSISQKKFDRWKGNKEKESQKLIEQQKQQKALAKENQLQFKKSISNLLMETEEIKGLSVSQKEIKELPNYISNTSVKLQDGRQITPFYRDLFESLKDPEKLVALAKLVRNDFDFGDIKKGIVTKQTQKLKEDLQRQSNNKPKRSSQKKRLIDLI